MVGAGAILVRRTSIRTKIVKFRQTAVILQKFSDYESAAADIDHVFRSGQFASAGDCGGYCRCCFALESVFGCPAGEDVLIERPFDSGPGKDIVRFFG